MVTKQDKLNRIRQKKNPTIHICAPSDVCAPGLARKLWGDNWVKYELTKAFRALGFRVTASRPDQKPPDILLHLSGGGIEYVYGKKIEALPNTIYKMIWVYSHPEAPNSRNLRGYDKIFCCSTFFTRTLQAMGYRDAQIMLGATAKRPPVPRVGKIYDLVFVGNNRGPYGKDGRKIINDMRSLGNLPYKIGIWGNNWKGKIPDAWFGGRYYDYPKIQNLYASSKVCLQDHRKEMVNGGFVSVKIFDILASGSLPICDANKGVDPIFKGGVPQYRNAQHLGQLLREYLVLNPDKRKELIKLGQQTAFACSWMKRAKLFVKEFVE